MAKLACKMEKHEPIGGWWCTRTRKTHGDSKGQERRSEMTEDSPTQGPKPAVRSEQAVMERGQELNKT